jgi:APA family basic amino acid/polyamine antiporter
MSFAILFVLIGDINTTASITSLGAFISFTTVNLALIWLRYRHPNIPRPFKVPLNIGKFPVLAFLGAVFSVFMIYQYNFQIMIIGILILLSGAVVYHLRKNKIAFV